MVVSIIAEAITASLTIIWVALGAAAAFVAARFGLKIEFQLAVFAGVMFVMFYWIRPVLVKLINIPRARKNLREMKGQKVKVLFRIDNARQTGRVSYRGMEWNARSEDVRTSFEAGETVTILRVEGLQMIVAAASDEAQTTGAYSQSPGQQTTESPTEPQAT